ncbi:M20/M25/M40 family metallo-hydrolase [Streptomyces hygroscopicus]|uniref:M20/M25/M40 family metallo-hydrolase n=1 Tax=Streptomyces hygroscopicus TaxID=1912 RepID=UPI00362B3EBC
MTGPTEAAQDEAVTLCSELIRRDSSNPTSDERAAAEYVAALLAEVGLDPLITEAAPGRANVVARIDGSEPDRDGLLVHHHLDVVPADPAEWKVHPFSGEIREGYVWGRGAVDMKGNIAATLAAVRDMRRRGVRPRRDLVLAFSADEEAGGHFGVKHLARTHRDLFDGCSEAIGEIGGFSLSVRDDLRFYMVQVAEKGQAWMRLTAEGRAGHGSMRNSANPVSALAEAVARIGGHDFPVELTPATRDFLEAFAAAKGVEFDASAPEALLPLLGSFARVVDAALRHTVNPTMLDSGYKINVVPSTAEAHIDGRFLPGRAEEFTAVIDSMLPPAVTREWAHHDISVETTFDGDLVEAMAAAVGSQDPQSQLVPYCTSAATDAKTYHTLGIRCFGFMPLRLPSDLDFHALFHGVDERVPVDSLHFAVRVLDRFLLTC